MARLLSNVSDAVVEVVKTISDELVEMSTIGELSLSVPSQIFLDPTMQQAVGRETL
jgi:hypothetical protein